MKARYVLGVFSGGKLLDVILECRVRSTWFADRFFEFLASKCADVPAPEGVYVAWDKYQ